MTLQTKLSLSISCAIALSVLFTVFLTWKRVNTLSIHTETSDFSSAAKTLEHILESSFFDYLIHKAQIVIETKKKIQRITMNTWRDIQSVERIYPPSEKRDELITSIIRDGYDHTDKTSARIFLTDEQTVLEKGIPDLQISPDTKNSKNETITSIIKSLKPNGKFFLIAASGEHDSYKFLYILPFTTQSNQINKEPKRLLICAQRLVTLFDSANQLLEDHFKQARQTISNSLFFEKSHLVLYDNSDTPLAHQGEYNPIQNVFQELKIQARAQNSVTKIIDTEQGEFLCHCSWIRAFDWYFLAAAPLEILKKPSKELISTITFAGLSILIMAIITTASILTRALQPLQYLSHCARKLASLDLSSQSGLAQMDALPKEKLPLNRNDEVGDLSKAFATMSHELANNIRSTMQVMTKQKRVEGELAAARDIQVGILPSSEPIPSEPGFSIAAFLEPAREVGGDLYDCFPLAQGTKAIVMGDVSGKGIPASLFMTMSVTLIRYALRSEHSPELAMNQVNALLEEHNPGSMFVTLFMGIYTPSTGELIYANGGHCLPIIMGADGAIRKLTNLSGPIVGAMPSLNYQLYKDVLAPGELCFLYTDGLTEAMNDRKELYGEERLIACMAKHTGLSPKAFQEAIFEDICAFRGNEPPSDDITMLTVARIP
ncbi:MAG: SpoIIE family protein phosphatase [Desulfovibrionaceae bacterium]|nr:SpoIIE family protein phosphatase [Desulfovibrionaceae bacterium]